ncbi:uncharacterized protein LOC124193034 [Daphnia pulex]|uniref:uncharacterized protein LOC124193034 n=1 Tax=Daphnia pulex TaxID=6669 RepID=UPI001EDD1C5D|nr:uncharacterized protein LOC124193034 [Daphnia pulex]
MVNKASYAVRCCVVVWWVDHWCIDVFLVWRLPNRNATTFPKATHATTSYCTKVYKYYTTKAPEFYTTISAAPSHYTDVLKNYSAPSYYTTKATEYDFACCSILLHRGSQLLHRGSR